MKLHIIKIYDQGMIGQLYGLSTETGEVLYTHFCTNIRYAPNDLILKRPERIEELKNRFDVVEFEGRTL